MEYTAASGFEGLGSTGLDADGVFPELVGTQGLTRKKHCLL